MKTAQNFHLLCPTSWPEMIPYLSLPIDLGPKISHSLFARRGDPQERIFMGLWIYAASVDIPTVWYLQSWRCKKIELVAVRGQGVKNRVGF